jgi:integrase
MVQINLTSNHGQIRIRFTYRGQLYNISAIGGYADKLDLARAKVIAANIELDTLTGEFDPTLIKYIGGPKPTPSKLIDVWNLWVATLVISERTKADHYHRIEALILKADPVPSVPDSGWLMEASKTVVAQTFNVRVRFLRRCLEWAVEQGLAENNPYEKIKSRKGAREKTKPLGLDQVQAIIKKFAEVEPQYAKFAAMMFLTGARHSEIIGLTWKRINLPTGELTIADSLTRGHAKGTKTGAVTVLIISTELRALLESVPKGGPDDYVFSVNGGPINIDKYGRAWKRVLAALEIPHVKPYVSRSTFASHSIDQGASMIEVAHMLGHKSVAMLDRHYANTVKNPTTPNLGL